MICWCMMPHKMDGWTTSRSPLMMLTMITGEEIAPPTPRVVGGISCVHGLSSLITTTKQVYHFTRQCTGCPISNLSMPIWSFRGSKSVATNQYSHSQWWRATWLYFNINGVMNYIIIIIVVVFSFDILSNKCSFILVSHDKCVIHTHAHLTLITY